MKLYKIDFDPMYPVPSGLIILAKNKKNALKMAETVLTHTKPTKATLIEQNYEKVVFFESGDYQHFLYTLLLCRFNALQRLVYGFVSHSRNLQMKTNINQAYKLYALLCVVRNLSHKLYRNAKS